MHKLISICCFLLFTETILSQKLTKEQMQAQMAEAKKESQQMIADLEKEIAEAKKRGDDAESIQELEKQLATMKKMLGVVEKAASPNTTFGRPETISKAEYPIPKYITPIVPLVLKQPVKIPTEKEATDRLLWYTGKKIDNYTLITTSGTVVRYDRPNNRVIVKPDQKLDSSFLKLVSKLSKTETVKNDFAKRIDGVQNSFLMYPEVIKAFEEFDYIRKRFDNISRNTLEFPANPIVKNSLKLISVSSRGAGVSHFIRHIYITGLEQAYQELLQIMNNPPALNFATPPKRPTDLCLCNSSIRQQYEGQLSDWFESFWKFEDDLLSKVKNLHRYTTDHNNTDLSSMPNFYQDIDRAMKLAITRKEDKVGILVANWGDDVHREEAVVMAKLALQREKQKWGLQPSTISYSWDNFGEYIKREMDARNYNVVFDYSLFLSHEFHRQLLGQSVNIDQTRFFRWMSRLEHYNRFDMTIDLDFEVEWRDMEDNPFIKFTGKLSSDPVLVSIGRLGCKWQLFLTYTDYLNGAEQDFRIPFKVKGGVMRVKKMQSWSEYPYTGPEDALMVFPSVRFDFCPGGSSDSAIMDVLRYKNEILNQQVVNVSVALEYTSDIDYTIELLACANKLLIPAEKVRDNSSEIVTMADEMLNFRSSIGPPTPTGNSILDQMQIEYSANLQQHKKQKELADIDHVNHSFILFDAVNYSDLLIDKNQPVSYEQPEIREYMTRGSIKLKVKHNPSPQWQFGPPNY